MAIKQGDEYFTRFAHLENGRVMNRRLHRLEVQAGDGRLYVLTGEKLPDFIQTNAGNGYKGEHLGQILLNPKAVSRWPNIFYDARPWPSWRDVVNFAIGFCAISALNFVASLIWNF